MLESARLLEGMGPCAGTVVLRVLLSLHRLWRGLTHSVLTTWWEEAAGPVLCPCSQLTEHASCRCRLPWLKNTDTKNVCIEANSTRLSYCNDQRGNWQGTRHFRDQGEPEASPAGTPEVVWRHRAREPVPPWKQKLCVSTKGRTAP